MSILAANPPQRAVAVFVLAAAIVRGARARGLALEFPTDPREEHGNGIEGTVAGRHVALGKSAWVTRRATLPPRAREVRRRLTRYVLIAVAVMAAASALAFMLSSVLQGITRDTVFALAKDLGFEVREASIPREFLYLADEAFFCGTAVEITPVRSFDRITVGGGKRGPITEALQERFFAILRGDHPDTHGWLTPVGAMVGSR